MLYGRPEERARIATLLADARRRRGGTLVVRGEAGVGKYALLQDAGERAGDFQLLRGFGVESEVEEPFAALHQLLRPVLDRLDRLPAPQADAVRGAFGLADTGSNRFLVELGVLGLLAGLARERPVLWLVNDAQWFDRASADTLVFVGRRLDQERVALLVAACDTTVRRFHAPGLPELHVRGLNAEAAGRLLEAQFGKLSPRVRDRLVDETGGNPLALLELPQTLTGDQLAGRESLPERIPLTGRVQVAFLQQVRPLPPETRTLLLVASVEGTGELAAVLAAGRVLGVGPAALEPAERAGLVRVGGLELRFRHPLVRSAIYQGATFLERQAAHRALAGELAGGPRADRRAWHLAAATPEPDEEVAGALEASADRARRRGGPAAAAAALERAAALTPEGGPRTRRMVAAADALWEAGQGIGALALLDRLHPPPADPATRAGIAHIRGAVELGAGTPATACTVLLEGARLVLDSDPGRAAELLTLASWAALAANQADRVLDEIGPAAAGLPDHDPRQRRVGLLVDSLNAAGFGRDGDAAAGVAAGPPAAGSWPHPAFTWMWPMLMVAAAGGTELGPDQQYVRSVAARRAAHTVTSLIIDLANLALAEAARGRWPDAAAAAAEGLRLATDNDQPATAGYFLAMLATIAAEQGRADDCRRLAAEALGVAASFRLAVVAALASWALAILDLTTGAPAAALERLMALHAPGHPSAHAPITLLATGTLVEAASRAGARTGMEPFVARLERWAARDRRAWTQVVARRCRALVSQGEEAERHFRAALATDGLAERPFELARTELLYGEWLRGARRRADARTHLRAALELFERMKVIPWAERARGELRASGETARPRNRGAGSRLTPRELEIACLAAQGLTNRQIADRLYLSAHTVGYHLHKVYAKLGITSRADLRGLGLDD